MSNDKKNKSSSHDRRVVGYPPPGTYQLLQQYMERHGCGESEAIVIALEMMLKPNKIIPKLNPA
jgi:hypothetical protein